MITSSSSSSLKTSRKYAVQHGMGAGSMPISPSPLSRDSTSTAVMPLRLNKSSRRGSFSTAHHTHGLGGEAKDAMLRNSGIRMRRTSSSLRIIATKGNATLSAAISHKVFVPELELYVRNYAHKEPEFAETIPSAMCPFQYITHEPDIIPFQRTKSSTDVKEAIDNTKLEEWLKEMRLKVHMRLVQRQVTNVTTPTEGHKLDDKRSSTPEENEKRKGGSDSDRKRGQDGDRKGSETDRKKGGSESSRKKGSESDRKKQDSDRKKRGHTYDTLEEPSRPPSRTNSDKKLVKPPSPTPTVPTVSKKSAFPPGATDPRKTLWGNKGGGTGVLPATRSASQNVASSYAPTTTAGGQSHTPYNAFDVSGNTPLFQSRKNPTLTRRTHSAYDVRRVRLKARNSVGMEPVW